MAGATVGCPLTTRDTVARETPARAATASRVGRFIHGLRLDAAIGMTIAHPGPAGVPPDGPGPARARGAARRRAPRPVPVAGPGTAGVSP
ncbi:hypothetical protein GCM10010466_55860 [Planomonospora alba]|uniref:Uncharacterized protein n=1 Tax=Planomonospora alba TaxID=161354 RepID=A0ABP6NYQ0_9ACTN